MYIQIDSGLTIQLDRKCFASGLMGSHAHGLQDEESDTDKLRLFYDANYEGSIHNENYGFQYKTEYADINYQEIRTYIRNLIIGDSPADFEALQFGFVSESVEWKALEEFLKSNINSYALIKSYLGYVKKDIKEARNIIKNTISSRALFKRLSHISRGLDTASNLIMTRPYSFGKNTTSYEFINAKTMKDGTNDLYMNERIIYLCI